MRSVPSMAMFEGNPHFLPYWFWDFLPHRHLLLNPSWNFFLLHLRLPHKFLLSCPFLFLLNSECFNFFLLPDLLLLFHPNLFLHWLPNLNKFFLPFEFLFCLPFLNFVGLIVEFLFNFPFKFLLLFPLLYFFYLPFLNFLCDLFCEMRWSGEKSINFIRKMWKTNKNLPSLVSFQSSNLEPFQFWSLEPFRFWSLQLV